MQVILQSQRRTVLRYDRGEEVWSGLEKFVLEQGIFGAHFTAIGAASEVTLAFYNLAKKEYLDRVFTEDMEIAGIVGNIAQYENKVVVHAHGTFSRKDYSVVGGHVKRLVVSATCEIVLHSLTSKLEREFDNTTGLNLLN